MKINDHHNWVNNLLGNYSLARKVKTAVLLVGFKPLSSFVPGYCYMYTELPETLKIISRSSVSCQLDMSFFHSLYITLQIMVHNVCTGKQDPYFINSQLSFSITLLSFLRIFFQFRYLQPSVISPRNQQKIEQGN